MGKGIRLVVKVSNRGRDSHDKGRFNSTSDRDNRSEPMKRESNSSFPVSLSPSTTNNQPFGRPNSSSSLSPLKQKVLADNSSDLCPPSFSSKGRGFASQFKSPKPTNSSCDSDVPLGGLQNKENAYSSSNQLNVSTNNSNQSKQLMTPSDFSGDDLLAANVRAMCRYCGNPSNKKCAVCRTPYCGVDCQTKDWSTHKMECKRLTKVRMWYVWSCYRFNVKQRDFVDVKSKNYFPLILFMKYMLPFITLDLYILVHSCIFLKTPFCISNSQC